MEMGSDVYKASLSFEKAVQLDWLQLQLIMMF